MGYLLNTSQQKAQMLEALGLSSLEDLHAGLPKEVLLSRELNLPTGKGELEVLRAFEGFVAKNQIFPTIQSGKVFVR